MSSYTIALIGNPNSGKSTLFNKLTDANQRVGNWSGVTVQRHDRTFSTKKQQITLVDLPGIYSLTKPSSKIALDEQITYNYLASNQATLFINVIDVTRLGRSLYLTLQLLERGIPCIIVLNMLDKAQAQGIVVNVDEFSKMLDVPIVSLIATQKVGFNKLYYFIDRGPTKQKPLKIPYPNDVETQIYHILQESAKGQFSCQRWFILQLLEEVCPNLFNDPITSALVAHAKKQIHVESGEDAALLIADARYQLINQVCQQVIQRQQGIKKHTSDTLDKIFLHRWLGIPLFLLIMYGIFYLSIVFGSSISLIFGREPEQLFICGIQNISNYVGISNWVSLLLAHGIGNGINTLFSLIPQITFISFFFFFLENSGYMARAVFIIDRLMRTLGLPGESFIPLMVSFGCNVPAIVGARVLVGEHERLRTILVTPFMVCSARLAIFVVFSSAFFGKNGVLLVFSLYLLGIFVAILTGYVLKNNLLLDDSTSFIMELPQYHWPHIKTLMQQIWYRLKNFVWRVGRVIILINLCLITLSTVSSTGKLVHDQMHLSVLCSVGRWMTPCLKPLGVTKENWQATVGLITGILAKEAVLGTLNTLYSAELIVGDHSNSEVAIAFSSKDQIGFDKNINNQSLHSKSGQKSSNISLEETTTATVEMQSGVMGVMANKFSTPVAAYSYLIFVLLYLPCISTLISIGRECGYRWMLFSFFWGLNAAYSLSTLYYQCATFALHAKNSSITISIVIVTNLFIIGIIGYLRRLEWFRGSNRVNIV